MPTNPLKLKDKHCFLIPKFMKLSINSRERKRQRVGEREWFGTIFAALSCEPKIITTQRCTTTFIQECACSMKIHRFTRTFATYLSIECPLHA